MYMCGSALARVYVRMRARASARVMCGARSLVPMCAARASARVYVLERVRYRGLVNVCTRTFTLLHSELKVVYGVRICVLLDTRVYIYITYTRGYKIRNIRVRVKDGAPRSITG